MRRLNVIVMLGAVLGLLGGVLTASPAVARGPGWTFLPPAPFTLPASYCGFPVYWDYPVSMVYAKILKTSDGSIITLNTGALTLSLTNLDTGKTITEVIPAAVKGTMNPDGSFTLRGMGPNGPIALTPTNALRFGLPIVSVVAGLLEGSFDPDGNLTSLSLKGHVLVDVCAALS